MNLNEVNKLNRIFIAIIAIFCFASCEEEEVLTDVKLIASDSIAKDAQLLIDGYFLDIFSEVEDSENVQPCLDHSENFPVISLTPNHTAPGKSFYDFVIISKDFRRQSKGTKVIEDGMCHKWELSSQQLRPVVDDRYEIQGMINVSGNDFYIKVYDEKNSDQAVLKIILNNVALVSNLNATKEVWEQNIVLENGMNFIAIESILEGDQWDTPVTPYIEISNGGDIQTFQIQSINDKPGAFLIASQK